MLASVDCKSVTARSQLDKCQRKFSFTLGGHQPWFSYPRTSRAIDFRRELVRRAVAPRANAAGWSLVTRDTREGIMRTKLLLPAAFAAAILSGQNQPVLGEEAVKVSDNVWAIMGFPNIAIVVGNRATLVVDTGLGPANGATVARVVAKLAPGNPKLFLTTTHFHPEHAAGEAGFPRGTILIRDAVQQREMELHGQEMVDMFAGRSATPKELLANATLRSPDITFDAEAKIDLGGVTARLLWFGGAHTKGDELTFVEPDRTLISGDVVQK